MNKHTKIAIVIAPFLAIGSYIATGYYADAKMKEAFSEERYLPLLAQETCQINMTNTAECKMSNGDFLLNLSQTPQGIRLATTHPITHAVISIVNDTNEEKLFKFVKSKNALNWQVDAPLIKNSLNDTATIKQNKLRVMILINKVTYLGEIEKY